MAYKYFACPQRRDTGGCQRAHKASRQSAKTEEFRSKEAASTKEEDGRKGEESQRTGRGAHGLKEEEESDSEDEDNGLDPSTKMDEKTLDASPMDMILHQKNEPSFSPNGLLDSDEGVEEEGTVSEEDVASEDLCYVFDKMVFTGGKVIMSHCFF